MSSADLFLKCALIWWIPVMVKNLMHSMIIGSNMAGQ